MSFILEKRKKSNKINRLQMKVFFLPNTSKRTGEQPRRNAISKNPLCNFIEITPTHGCVHENPQHIRRTPLSRRTSLGDCFCMSKEF